MNSHILNIAVGIDKRNGWHKTFVEALDIKARQGHRLKYNVVDIDSRNWIRNLESYDVILWNPHWMGPQSAGHFKEKIFFIEQFLGKLVIPNFATIWHFESKVAQSYLFEHFSIVSPKTTVTFDYFDANECLRAAKMPLVFKKSHGASSSNVQLVSDRKKAKQLIDKIFCQQLWDEAKKRHASTFVRIIANFFKPWFWSKVNQKKLGNERLGVIYWQEFIPGNNADLRLTVIGDKYAIGFWRNNRPNDFRASGSGLIDYQREIPHEVIHYCLKINRELGFDSMAYDLLFTNDRFVIVEMSYNYIDRAVYNAKGYFELLPGGNLDFHKGNIWPQMLWIEWALYRAELKNFSKKIKKIE